MPKAQTPNLSTASPASRQRQLAIPRALGGAGGSGGDPDDWLERIKQGNGYFRAREEEEID